MRAETPLEMARRHVAEGTMRVEDQRALVGRLCREGADTRALEDLLRTLEQTLEAMRDDLRRLEAKA